MIFWKSSVLRDLLGVEMRIGKSVWRSLDIISVRWHRNLNYRFQR